MEANSFLNGQNITWNTLQYTIQHTIQKDKGREKMIIQQMAEAIGQGQKTKSSS